MHDSLNFLSPCDALTLPICAAPHSGALLSLLLFVDIDVVLERSATSPLKMGYEQLVLRLLEVI
jgi:hypothetical protein